MSHSLWIGKKDSAVIDAIKKIESAIALITLKRPSESTVIKAALLAYARQLESSNHDERK